MTATNQAEAMRLVDKIFLSVDYNSDEHWDF